MAYVPAELRLRFWTFSAWWRFMFAIRLSCLSDIRDSQRRLMHTPAVPLESKGSNWWSVPLIEDSVYTDREYKIMERLNTVAWNSNARMTRPTNDAARALADATHAPSVWTVLLVDFHRSSCSLEIKKTCRGFLLKHPTRDTLHGWTKSRKNASRISKTNITLENGSMEKRKTICRSIPKSRSKLKIKDYKYSILV